MNCRHIAEKVIDYFGTQTANVPEYKWQEQAHYELITWIHICLVSLYVNNVLPTNYICCHAYCIFVVLVSL